MNFVAVKQRVKSIVCGEANVSAYGAAFDCKTFCID